MEILTEIQKKILLLINSLPEKDAFYLTGGTALSAFYLKHRKSHDLDFFTTVEEIILPFSQKVERVLTQEGLKIEKKRGLSSFVELLVMSGSDSTVIHLALDTPFRFEEPREFSDFPGVKIDSLIDIAVNKLLALFGRAELRDFIDIYFLREHFSKNDLIEKAKRKDKGFDLYWLGVAMERIENFPDSSTEMYLLIQPCNMNELKEFFRTWREEIAKELLNSKQAL